LKVNYLKSLDNFLQYTNHYPYGLWVIIPNSSVLFFEKFSNFLATDSKNSLTKSCHDTFVELFKIQFVNCDAAIAKSTVM
jgi:hypothetical protein